MERSGRGLLLLLLALAATACGDEATRNRALTETVASGFRKDCESAPAPDEAMRRHLVRLCACSEAKIAATGMRFGEGDKSIGAKIEAASQACLAEIGGAPGEAPRAAAKASPAGCADGLAFVMNPSPSQLAVQEGMPSDRLERVRSGTERRFKAVAKAMCASGDLPDDAFESFDRVLITDAEGASEPTLYAGERRTLHYELAFAADQSVPADEAFRKALMCLEDRNRDGCYGD